MGATKIINVLKDDKFEELLDIVKGTDASEVVFVLPKQARAFKSEGHFVVLADEAKDSGKSVSFLCSNPEINELAKKYKFDILSTKTEPSPSKRTGQAASLIIAKNDDVDDDADPERGRESSQRASASYGMDDEEDKETTHDEFGEHHSPFGKEPEEPEEVVEETPTEEEEEDYKEAKTEEETAEEDAPYGTELDESGNPVYDEEEGERIGEEIALRRPATDFQVSTVSARQGMRDVVRPSSDKNIKIAQKDKRPVKVETHAQPGLSSRVPTETDIQSVWGHESSDSIWADISKPHPPTGKFRQQPSIHRKKGLNFSFKNFPKKGLVVLSVSSILILITVIFMTVGSAKIDIKPRSQTLGIQLKVAMSSTFPSVDSSFNRIPGQLFTISKSGSDEFNTTAEKDAVQKSRGTITIYNEYSTSPQPLVATTRFEHLRDRKAASEGGEPRQGRESGLVFRTLQTVTVPGMKVENGVVTPGRVNVEVIADKAGQAYNISAGDFGIMAWREKGDTARYEKIYGRSTGSMHGGILGKAKVVSEFDYNNAKDNLTAKVKNNISEALKTQSAGLELFTDIEPKIDSTESTAEVDDAGDTFTMTVSGSIMTIGYKKEDLMALIANHVDKTSGLMIVPEKLELSYKNIIMNPASNTLEAIVIIGGQAYAKIDPKNIAANLMGKNELQIKGYLGSIKDIDSAKVILSPFWVKKIPKNNKKIDILLTY